MSPTPLSRDRAIELLREHMDELRALGVESLSLFGSVARDEAGVESDVDVLMEHRPGISLFDYGGIQIRLVEIFGRPVDLATPDALKPRIRDRVLAEAVRAA
ncbi:MAG TPA: nucleotidyltransferase family protein [Archangium sp.]